MRLAKVLEIAFEKQGLVLVLVGSVPPFDISKESLGTSPRATAVPFRRSGSKRDAFGTFLCCRVCCAECRFHRRGKRAGCI